MRITSNYLILCLSKLLNASLLFLETILIARILGVSQFGQWTLLIAAGTILHNILINWSHSFTLRSGCEEWVTDKSLTKTINTRVPFLFIGLLLSFLLLIFQPLSWVTNLFSLPSETSGLVFVYVISLWLMLEVQSHLQAINSLYLQALLTPLINGISVITLALILLSVEEIEVTYLFPMIIGIKSFLWGLLCLYGIRKMKIQWKWPQANQLMSFLLLCWPLLPMYLLGYLSDWGDHILLGWFCKPYEVGLWSISYQMMLGIISFNSIFSTILLPWLIAREQNSANIMTYYINDIVPTIISLWLLANIVLMTIAPSLFALFLGKNSPYAESVMSILSIGILTNIFPSLYGMLFLLQGRQKQSLIYILLMVITNLGLSLLFIPKFGILGAAGGTIISYLVTYTCYVLDQHWFLKISLKKIWPLLIVSYFVGGLQLLTLGELWLRSLWAIITMTGLILIIRKTRAIKADLISKYFTGVLHPIGQLIKKIMIPTHVNKSY